MGRGLWGLVVTPDGLQENNPVTCALGARRLTAGLASNAP